MKNLLALAGIALTALGLVLLARGVGEMMNIASEACFETNCVDNADLFISFGGGIALLTIGPIIWNAGANAIRNSAKPNLLGWLGYLGIFGVSFGGVGATMLIQALQPNAENPGGVLTILGVMFGLVGLASFLVEIWFHLSERNVEKLRASGLHGRGIVTGIHDTGITVNLDPVVKFDLRVEVPGVTPYATSVRHTVSRLSVGAVGPGLILPVLADPAHPDRITVDWDSPITSAPDPGSAATAGGTSAVPSSGTAHHYAAAAAGLAMGVAGASSAAASAPAGSEAAALSSAAAALNAAAAAAEARSGGSAGAGGAGGAGTPIDLGTTINVQGGTLSPELLRTVSQALAAAAASDDLRDMPVMTIDARGLTHGAEGQAISGAGAGAGASPGTGAGIASAGPTGDSMPARVQIDSMQDTGVDMGGARLFAFDLTVLVSGRQPYKTRYAGSVPTNLVPRLSKGASFPAIVDPARPGDLTIEWDR